MPQTKHCAAKTKVEGEIIWHKTRSDLHR